MTSLRLEVSRCDVISGRRKRKHVICGVGIVRRWGDVVLSVDLAIGVEGHGVARDVISGHFRFRVTLIGVVPVSMGTISPCSCDGPAVPARPRTEQRLENKCNV